MSAVYHKHLYCDLCKHPLDSAVDGSDEIIHQRKLSKMRGWVTFIANKRRLDVCGGCISDAGGKGAARKQLEALPPAKREAM